MTRRVIEKGGKGQSRQGAIGENNERRESSSRLSYGLNQHIPSNLATIFPSKASTT